MKQKYKKTEAITITLIIQVNQHISKKAAKWKKEEEKTWIEN